MSQIESSLAFLRASWSGSDEDRRMFAQLKDLERKRRALDDKYGLDPYQGASRSAGTRPSQKMSEPVSRGKTLKELLGIEKEQG